MFLGIDIGTSAVKTVLVDDAQNMVAADEAPLHPSQPKPGWSEDAPEAWWETVATALDRLAARHPRAVAAVRGIGLSGQMHGVLLLDAQDRPVRPAMLWNDSRGGAEADALAALGPALQNRMGVRPMPAFTGPKIAWLRRHEPGSLAAARHLLLPKDYIRLRLTGERITDVSDAAGTWLFDQGARSWSAEAIDACGVDPGWLPGLVESTAEAGRLRPALATRWGMEPGTVVAGGGGDTAVGGIGIGAVGEAQGFVSLGTSGQVFLASARFQPAPERLVHSFCHALPGAWYRMAALLNGASPIAAVARWTGRPDVGGLLCEVEAAFAGPSRLLALPYLFGERTPHNDPDARGALVGLSGSTTPLDIAQAMMEAVAFSLADGLAVLVPPGQRPPERLGFIGGGSRSRFWGRLIASVLDVALVRYDGAERGPAFGAARLGRLAATGESPAAVVTTPAVAEVLAPDRRLHDLYRPRVDAFRLLYAALKPILATEG